MTLEQAKAIRVRQLQGAHIAPELLAQAIEVIRTNACVYVPLRPRREPKVQVETSNPQPLEVPDFREWSAADVEAAREVDMDAIYRRRTH